MIAGNFIMLVRSPLKCMAIADSREIVGFLAKDWVDCGGRRNVQGLCEEERIRHSEKALVCVLICQS